MQLKGKLGEKYPRIGVKRKVDYGREKYNACSGL